MKRKSRFIPIYSKVAANLQEKIESGYYPPGSQLPTEDQLAQKAGVSSITVRAAMRVLIEKGLVERFPRRGTFVLERTPPEVVWAIGNLNDLDAATQKSEMTNVWTKMVLSPNWVWRAMCLDGPKEIHTFRNLRLVNGEPFMLSDTYHPPSLTSMVSTEDFAKLMMKRKLVVVALAEYASLRLHNVYQELSATSSDRSISRKLRIKEGTPTLLVDRIFRTHEGNVVQVARTYYRVDHYRYTLNFTATNDVKQSTL